METNVLLILFISVALSGLVLTSGLAYGQIPHTLIFMKSNSVAHIYLGFSTTLHNQTMKVPQINVYDLNLTNHNPLNLPDLSIATNKTWIYLDNNHTKVDYTITAKNNLTGIFAILQPCGFDPFVVGLNSSQINPSILHKFPNTPDGCLARPAIESEVLIGAGLNHNTVFENLTAYVPPPLKQIRSGVFFGQIQCERGFIVTFKLEDHSPACVKPDTAIILFKRGWGQNVMTAH